MPNVSDILLGKLALREELVSTAALMEVMARQHQDPNADLGELLVQRRLISVASLSDLRIKASKAQLTCVQCSRTFRPDQLVQSGALACACGGELQIVLDGKPISDRIATGPTQRFQTVVLDEDPTEDGQPLPPKPPPPTRKEFGRLGKSFTGQFGAYEIVEELGRGGMGVVYKARQPRLNRFVALKILLAGPLASRTQTERFRREAEITARLRHPGIVQIHDVGKVGEHDYFTMDFVEGTPLNLLIRRRQVPIRRAVELARDVAQALHHAHERGAIHRDVKPANLIVGPTGNAVLTDFGLARDMDQDEAHRLTNSGSVVGTPYYMAPEQARGERELISGWTDVYALGVVLYECLTYRVPFRAKTHLELTKKILGEAPQPPSQIEPAVDLELEGVVLKAMAKDPEDRYPTAQAMAEDLTNFLEGRPTSVGATAGQRVVRELRRRGAWLGGAVLITILILGGVWAAAAALAPSSGPLTPPDPVTPPPPPPTVNVDDEQAQAMAEEAFAAFRSARQANERSGAYREALERAEARATEALSLDESRADLWVLRGRISSGLSHEREALSDLTRAAEVDPSGAAGAEAGYLLASLHHRADRPQEARVALRAALDRMERPGPWGALLRGTQSVLDGDFDEALTHAQQAVAEDPELPEASFLRGVALKSLGRTKEAQVAFERAVRLDDKDPVALANLGGVSLLLGDATRGVEALSRALELRPELSDVRWTRARAYRQLGRLDEALQDLRALERGDPDSVPLLCELAQLSVLRHRVDEAQEAADRALEHGAGIPQVYVTRAGLDLYRYDTRGALAELRAGLDAVEVDHPEFDEFERYFLVLSLGSEQTELLREYIDAQCAALPLDAQGRYTLFRVLVDFSTSPEPNLDALREACYAEPTYVRGWSLLFAYMLKNEATPAELRDELQRMLRAAPDEPAVLATAARLQFSLNNREEGERWLTLAIDRAPHDPDVLVSRAMLSQEPRAALGFLVEAVDARPLRHEYHVILGSVLKAVSPAQAEVHLQAALALVPFEVEASMELAQLYLDTKRPEQCVSFVRRTRELYEGVNRVLPFPLTVLLTRGLLAQNKRDEALAASRVAVSENASTLYAVESRCYLVLTLRQANEQEEYERELEALLSEHPDHPSVKELQGVLSR
ncbi:MAG: protein kinase [Planctomycetota bacterium]